MRLPNTHPSQPPSFSGLEWPQGATDSKCPEPCSVNDAFSFIGTLGGPELAGSNDDGWCAFPSLGRQWWRRPHTHIAPLHSPIPRGKGSIHLSGPLSCTPAEASPWGGEKTSLDLFSRFFFPGLGVSMCERAHFHTWLATGTCQCAFLGGTL